MAYQAILFDKDGTLFDFHATWGEWTQGFLSRVSRGDTARARALGAAIGYDCDSARFTPDSIVVAGTNEEIAHELGRHMSAAEAGELLARFDAATLSVSPVAAVPLLPLLGGFRQRGLVLGVATNDSEASARAHLERAGVAGLFDFIAGHDSGHGGKPDPGMLLAFVRETGVAPARTVMVGDSRHDLLAGRAAGMTPVAVLTGPAAEAELAPLAEAVLPDIGHLPDWLAAHGT